MNTIFKGAATAMITPFTKDNKINFDAFEKQIAFQIKNNIDALVVLGTTGEPSVMSNAERKSVIDFAVKTVKASKSKIKIIIGTGSNNTETAVENNKYAENAGADALLAVTPYYNKCTQNGLVKYYESICASVSVPVICYNVPGRTGLEIMPQTYSKLCEIKNLAATKEACGKMEAICETAKNISGKMDLYSGDDMLTLPLLSIGAKGVISVLSNVFPAEVKELTNKFFSGDINGAVKLHEKLVPLFKAAFCEVNPIPIKFMSEYIGLGGGIPRAPLTELEEENKDKIIKILKEFK